jgi:hypothetical protein
MMKNFMMKNFLIDQQAIACLKSSINFPFGPYFFISSFLIFFPKLVCNAQKG